MVHLLGLCYTDTEELQVLISV